MIFTVEFYETDTGKCPVTEFLDTLKESNPDDFAAVMAGLAKGSRKNNFTFLALRFRLGLVDFEEHKAQ